MVLFVTPLIEIPRSPSPSLVGLCAGTTYQSAGAVDACVAGVDAVEPLGLAELPEALFRHGSGRNREVR